MGLAGMGVDMLETVANELEQWTMMRIQHIDYYKKPTSFPYLITSKEVSNRMPGRL